jgi:hypothetical protein
MHEPPVGGPTSSFASATAPADASVGLIAISRLDESFSTDHSANDTDSPAADAGVVLQRAPDGSLSFEAPPSWTLAVKSQEEAPAGGPSESFSSRAEAAEPVAVQRAAEAAAPTSTAAPRPTSGGGEVSKMATSELDELARRLYVRLRTELQRELRHDRERVGLNARQ